MKICDKCDKEDRKIETHNRFDLDLCPECETSLDESFKRFYADFNEEVTRLRIAKTKFFLTSWLGRLYRGEIK